MQQDESIQKDQPNVEGKGEAPYRKQQRSDNYESRGRARRGGFNRPVDSQNGN